MSHHGFALDFENEAIHYEDGSSGIPGGYLTKRLIRVSSNALPRFLAL